MRSNTLLRLALVSALILALFLLSLSGCIERKPEKIAAKESPVSTELRQMVTQFDALYADSTATPKLLDDLFTTSRDRVYLFLAQSLLREPEDMYRAALILQQSPGVNAIQDNRLAHFLAREAAVKGYHEARKLAATTLDRYLVLSGLPQLYGTQTFMDSLGVEALVDVDPATSDSERVAWGVDSLHILKSMLISESE